MLTLQFEVGTNQNSYTILVDGHKYCNTSNDDDGLKLMIAVAILKGNHETKTPLTTSPNLWPTSCSYELQES